MARRKIRTKVHKIFAKNEKVKKSIFDEIYLKIEGSIEINRPFSNKYFIAGTGRAGWLILGSKSNTVSEMSASRGLATYRYSFV